MPQERLHKIIANAGITSRRAAEELITTGRVSVNGDIVSELGAKADPDSDRITVDGKPVVVSKQHMYLMMHKPKGYVTTVSDPEGRPTVMDLLPPDCPRVYPIGRLDYLTEGLLLFTNDGDLAYRLTQASSHVPKTYLVKVAGQPTEEDVERLRTGVKIEKTSQKGHGPRVKTAPAQIKWVRFADNPWLEVTLIEGRNRQIRKMFEEVGHHVEKIRRIAYGPIELDLETGAMRSLKLREVYELRRCVLDQKGAKEGKTVVKAPEVNPSPKTRKFLQNNAAFEQKKRVFASNSRPVSSASPAGREQAGERFPKREFRSAERSAGDRPPRRESRGESPQGSRGEFRPAVRPTGDRPPRREFANRSSGDRPPRREFRPTGQAEARPYRKPQERDRDRNNDQRARPAAYANSRPRRESQSASASAGKRPPSSGRPQSGARPYSGERPARREFPARDRGPRPSASSGTAGGGAKRPYVRKEGERGKSSGNARPPRREAGAGGGQPRQEFRPGAKGGRPASGAKHGSEGKPFQKRSPKRAN